MLCFCVLCLQSLCNAWHDWLTVSIMYCGFMAFLFGCFSLDQCRLVTANFIYIEYVWYISDQNLCYVPSSVCAVSFSNMRIVLYTVYICTDFFYLYVLSLIQLDMCFVIMYFSFTFTESSLYTFWLSITFCFCFAQWENSMLTCWTQTQGLLYLNMIMRYLRSVNNLLSQRQLSVTSEDLWVRISCVQEMQKCRKDEICV